MSFEKTYEKQCFTILNEETNTTETQVTIVKQGENREYYFWSDIKSKNRKGYFTKLQVEAVSLEELKSTKTILKRAIEHIEKIEKKEESVDSYSYHEGGCCSDCDGSDY